MSKMGEKYNHNEAYNLMLYKCEECDAMEILWNSRDGVTPFCIICRHCHKDGEFPTMLHQYWQLDTKIENYKPYFGQRIFIGKPDKPSIEIYGDTAKEAKRDNGKTN